MYKRHAVGFSLEDIVTSDQTHTTNVQLVGAEDRGKGVTRPRTYKDVDGMKMCIRDRAWMCAS